MECFNFSHLPLLVKEMIADEIVHNSIPEDRIQFATTCKAFNQLVKHAKPKKIIRESELSCYETGVCVYINSRYKGIRNLSELKRILQQYQVENISISIPAWGGFHDEHFYSELLEILMEPCRFVIVLNIDSHDPEFNYVDFYKKLRHLKSLTIRDWTEMIMDLPYFPPKLELRSDYSLPLLAKKTLNHPLSFLKITEEVPLADIQQFLMTVNLEIGAEIFFCFEKEPKTFDCFLTFIANDLFEFEIHCSSRYLTLDQQMNKQNKMVLKLSTDHAERIPFTVTSNSNIVVCSGKFTTEFQKTVSENVAECVKVLFPRDHYSPKLLDNWFPRTENYDPFERVKTMNKTFGTYISVIEPEMLEEKFILDQYSLHPTTNPVQIDPEWSTQIRKRYYD